mgnify:CR=1 FL=1
MERIPVDFSVKIRYDLYMISMRDAIEAELSGFVERHTGVKPDLKPSKKAHASSSAFLRADASAAAALLNAHAEECTLLSAPLLKAVTAENGWLLFFLTAEAIDAFANALPPAEEPDDTYFARRLWIAYRHADAETPDDPALLDGFYAALMRAPFGERRFLSAPRAHDGTERIALEQRTARMAKILLWERRNMICSISGSDTRPF